MEMQQPDFDCKLFDQLWAHKLIDNKGIITTDDKELKKFKDFLEEQSRAKTAQLYKIRKEKVDKVQRLLKCEDRPPIKNKNIVSLVKDLSLDFDKWGYLEAKIEEMPSKEPSLKFRKPTKRPKFAPPSFSVLGKKLALNNERAKATRRDMQVLKKWLNEINIPFADVKKPDPPSDADFEKIREASIELDKKRFNDMEISRKLLVNERYADNDAKLKRILGPQLNLIKPYEVKKSYREQKVADHEPKSTPERSSLTALERKWQFRKRSRHTPEASLKDVDESTMARLEKSKCRPKFGRVKGKYSKTAVKKIFSDSDLINPKAIRALSDEHKDPLLGLKPEIVSLEELANRCQSDRRLKSVPEKSLKDIDEITKQKIERLEGHFELSKREIKRDPNIFVKKLFSDTELIKPSDIWDSSDEYKDHTPDLKPENVPLHELAKRCVSAIDIRQLSQRVLKDVDESTRKRMEEVKIDPTVSKVEGKYADGVVKKIFSESKIIIQKDVRTLSDEHKDPVLGLKPELITLDELADRCISDIPITHISEKHFEDIEEKRRLTKAERDKFAVGKVEGKYTNIAVKKTFSESEIIYPKSILTLSDEHKDPVPVLKPEISTLDEIANRFASNIGIRRARKEFLRDIDKTARQTYEKEKGRFEPFLKTISDAKIIIKKDEDRKKSLRDVTKQPLTITDKLENAQKRLSAVTSREDLKRLSSVTSRKDLKRLSSVTSREYLKRLSSVTSREDLKRLSSVTSREDLKRLSSVTRREDLKRLSSVTSREDLKRLSSVTSREDLKRLSSVTSREDLKRLSSVTSREDLKRLSSVTRREYLKPSVETSSEKLRRRGTKVEALTEKLKASRPSASKPTAPEREGEGTYQWPKVMTMEDSFPDVANAILERTRAFRKNKGLILNNTLYRKLSESKFKKTDD